VSRGLSLFLRSVVLVIALGCATHFVVTAIQRSDWNKERLYHKLMSGDSHQQVNAASTLVYVQGEKQLLAALKAEKAEVRDTARRALEYLWFIREGTEAFEMMQAASKAYDGGAYQEALNVLDKLIAKHPRYAEAWNRRACVYWKMERYDESIADCERVITLNPNHYGAWQGLGVCKLHQGDVEEAVRCLKAVLRITPYDESVITALKKCEDLLQNIPPSKYRQRLETV